MAAGLGLVPGGSPCIAPSLLLSPLLGFGGGEGSGCEERKRNKGGDLRGNKRITRAEGRGGRCGMLSQRLSGCPASTPGFPSRGGALGVCREHPESGDKAGAGVEMFPSGRGPPQQLRQRGGSRVCCLLVPVVALGSGFPPRLLLLLVPARGRRLKCLPSESQKERCVQRLISNPPTPESLTEE